ncbi:hypothetical protein BH09VER1_BH09VER1_09260 [soil metagenome]
MQALETVGIEKKLQVLAERPKNGPLAHLHGLTVSTAVGLMLKAGDW